MLTGMSHRYATIGESDWEAMPKHNTESGFFPSWSLCAPRNHPGPYLSEAWAHDEKREIAGHNTD